MDNRKQCLLGIAFLPSHLICLILAYFDWSCLTSADLSKSCMQAPVPYLNRALAEEQLGVDADEQGQHQLAQEQYAGAVKVLLAALVCTLTYSWHHAALLLLVCRQAPTPFVLYDCPRPYPGQAWQNFQASSMICDV